MPPAAKTRATRTRKTVIPQEPTIEVKAAAYTEDPDWDGSPEESNTMSVQPGTDTDNDASNVKKTRTVSPLVAASRAYDKANKRADKARTAAAKVKNVADELAEAESAETAAYNALSALLNR